MRRPDLATYFGTIPLVAPAPDEFQWAPDGTALTYLSSAEDEEGSKTLWRLDLVSGARTLLLSEDALLKASAVVAEAPRLTGYAWFPDSRRLLLQHGGRAWECCTDDRSDGPHLLFEGGDECVAPLLSPAGDRLAFVRDHDLWVLDLGSDLIVRLTADGSDTVLNGGLDWAYWEELGHRSQWRAFVWSPDGSRIAFLRLDQHQVPEYPLVEALSTHPKLTRQRYPKAGDPNSIPRLRMVDAATGSLLAEAEPGTPDGYLTPQFVWTPDGTGVAFCRLDRPQQTLELCVLAPDPEQPDGRVETIARFADPHWLNYTGPAWHCPSGGSWPADSFLWVGETEHGARVVLCEGRGDTLSATPLGPENHPVDTILALSAAHAVVQARTADPRRTTLLALRPDGWTEITPEPGTHTAQVRPDGQGLVNTHSTVQSPPVQRLLRPVAEGIWHAHADLHGPDPGWQAYDWARVEWHTVRGPDGTPLQAQLLVPPDFDPGMPHPVVVRVYGGPHGQQVRDTWLGDHALDQLLVGEGFLVWRLDSRGSWGRGHVFETPVARRLGKCELEDQVAGVEYLRRLPGVAPDRIGISGWSYGGYLTLYALTHGPTVWRCGVAGAPVTDWKLYDSIYTERYMGTPADNPEGYRAASVLEAAGALAAPVLLVHGTDDDNVHLQHTLQLLEALSRAGKPYDLLLQPQQKHSFRSKPIRRYCHQRTLEFFRRHLGHCSVDC